MKRRYEKPTLCVERYALTQTIASCSGIKIYAGDDGIPTQDEIKADPNCTNVMKNLMRFDAFLSASGDCSMLMDGRTSDDGVCYHTNINAAFTS